MNALNFYWNKLSTSEKINLKLSSNPKASYIGIYNNTLPAIPDVAIHYRCGDNTVGHYGFLPFRAFTQIIQSPVQTIYIMTESSSRKSRDDQRIRCNLLLKSLHTYLVKSFPNTIVLLLRGQDIYTDLYRLTFANITICSVSTFCLYPAIANSNSAYFPVTRLAAKATKPYYGTSFHWVENPPVFHGVKALGISHERLINILKAPG